MPYSTINSLIDDMGQIPVEIPHGEPGASLKLVGGRPSRTDLQSEIGRLNLVVEALVRLVVRKGLTKPADLAELLAQIDREDGLEDGQLKTHRTTAPEWCTECEARIAPGWTSCAFCGQRYDERIVRIGEPLDQDSGKPVPKFPERCPDCDAFLGAAQPACGFCGSQFEPTVD